MGDRLRPTWLHRVLTEGARSEKDLDIAVILAAIHARGIRGAHSVCDPRLHATLDYLTLVACSSLRDSSTSDINTLTNVARILVQDVTDVFGVIERRGLES